MEESLRLGNQQESDVDLAWVGGFIDGEGSITLSVSRQKGGYVSIVPNVSVSNTHKPSLERMESILKSHGVGVYFQHRKGTKRVRPLYVLQITGMKRCLKMIETVGPYLFTKQKQGEVFTKYLESRLERPSNASYSDDEIEWAIELREMNTTRNAQSSETVRQALYNRKGAA